MIGWSRSFGIEPVDLVTTGLRSEIKCTWNLTVCPEIEFDKIIASICVAALPIGKSGILANRKARTYDLMDGLRRKQLADFGANVQDETIVADKNIITSTGPSTG